VNELRILSPCGILGYGFPEASLTRGLDLKPDVIAVDAGSTDAGPHKLGAGVGIVTAEAARRDLEPLLRGAFEQKIPLLIGSAGGAGAATHLDWTLDIINQVVRQHGLAFDTAVIHADVSKETVRRKLNEGRLRPLGPAPDLDETGVADAIRIVGQMGCEPFVAALRHGAQLVVAGRAYDPAPFAALPLARGFDPALAVHLGKILECGALCAEPGTTKDAILGRLREDGFLVEPLDEGRACRTTSVAAHTLYEKDHPFRLEGPGIALDLSDCVFEQVTDRTVRVSGSRMKAPSRYTIKLEGASRVAYRTIVIAGVRDPILVANIDALQQGVVEQLAHRYADVSPSDYQILFHTYGKNGVMGPLEPHPEPAHELGVVLEVVAKTQQLADEICASARSTMLHYPLPGRKSTAGNLAFLYAPSDISCGPVYRFTIYHLAEVDDPGELFPITYARLG